ncbi:hypothetical protein LZ554_009537 [Drepanopeziza brunnea f. sp. 'monogermtubi']|nr:hypothetical protein LZ554_009537 [Drepanopeziza brunnea f. sp. 'monogermtubi']
MNQNLLDVLSQLGIEFQALLDALRQLVVEFQALLNTLHQLGIGFQVLFDAIGRIIITVISWGLWRKEDSISIISSQSGSV